MSAAESYQGAEEEMPAIEQTASRKRDKFNSFLKESWQKGVVLGREEVLKGEIALKQSLGLGPRPNVIPPGPAEVKGSLRKVELGWHPVAGGAGKWFAENTVGKSITKSIGKYPDPTQHWAVLVGDYCHELWMDEHLDVIYINEVLKKDEWHTFEVGQTRFSDEALRQTGEMVIYNMRQKRPLYNLISNNCQNFATSLLDAIQIGAHREFGSTFEIYSRATGKGAIKDLFSDPPDEQPDQEASGQSHQDTVQNAQNVMDQNTTKLDHHH